ncbi:hypothetical protein [Marinicella sp. W31]|uniref:hypothetical protein n=1 Tax=Marinicella sp. W31 TaxID=3023713 RepID=UPI003757AC42
MKYFLSLILVFTVMVSDAEVQIQEGADTCTSSNVGQRIEEMSYIGTQEIVLAVRTCSAVLKHSFFFGAYFDYEWVITYP